MSERRLQSAVQAVKTGQYEVARTILSRIVIEEPDNAQAWLWLSFAVGQEDRKLDCLKQVLRIQPGNQTALKEVARLEEKLKTTLQELSGTGEEPSPLGEQEKPSESNEPVMDEENSPEEPPAPDELENSAVDLAQDSPVSEKPTPSDPSSQDHQGDKPKKKRSRRISRLLLILLIASLCILIAFLGLVYLPNLILPPLPGERLPAGARVITNSPEFTSTMPATETPTPTATETPTLTPTQTQIPSATITETNPPTATAMGGSGSIAFVSDQLFNSEIFLMDVDTGKFLNLSKNPAYDGMPVWSPDGKTLLFASERDSLCDGGGDCSQAYLLELETGLVKKVAEFDSVQVLPQSWLPGGRVAVNVNLSKEILDENQTPEYDLFLVESGISEPKLWKEEPGWEWLQDLNGNLYPVWAPNGESVLVNLIDTAGGLTELYLVNPDGTDPQSLAPESLKEGRITQPSWSPDSKWIAFVYTSGEGEDIQSSIYILEIDGSGLINLTENGEINYPSWSPDGKLIAYASNTNGGWEIFSVEVKDGNVQQITMNTGQDLWPAWRP